VLGLTFAALVWVARALAGSRPPAWAGSSGRADTAAPGANLAPGQHAAPPQPTPDLDGAPLRPGWYGFALLVIAVVAAGCAIFLYNWLSQWHWPVTLTASATVSAPHESILQDLELTAGMNGSPVRWLVDSGSARQLTVSGPDTGTAEIILPLRRSWCARMAARLKASCGGGQLSLNSPVTFDWSNTQQFASTDAPQRTVSSRLDITEAIARPGVLEMEVTAVTRARPSLCFSSPLNAVTLTVTSGPLHFRHKFSGHEPTVPCASGTSVLIGSPGSGMPPALAFVGIRTFGLRAWASAASLHGFAGQLELDPGGTTVTGGPADVLVCSRKAGCPLAATLGIGEAGQAGQSLVVHSHAATNVITKGGQLVPSAWARKTAIFGPLLGGFVSALVVGPLTVFMQVLMDAMKSRFRKARREKEARHAL
jgi:hypothetical protein